MLQYLDNSESNPKIKRFNETVQTNLALNGNIVNRFILTCERFSVF